jgi:hypothetical protein
MSNKPSSKPACKSKTHKKKAQEEEGRGGERERRGGEREGKRERFLY